MQSQLRGLWKYHFYHLCVTCPHVMVTAYGFPMVFVEYCGCKDLLATGDGGCKLISSKLRDIVIVHTLYDMLLIACWLCFRAMKYPFTLTKWVEFLTKDKCLMMWKLSECCTKVSSVRFWWHGRGIHVFRIKRVPFDTHLCTRRETTVVQLLIQVAKGAGAATPMVFFVLCGKVTSAGAVWVCVLVGTRSWALFWRQGRHCPHGGCRQQSPVSVLHRRLGSEFLLWSLASLCSCANNFLLPLPSPSTVSSWSSGGNSDTMQWSHWNFFVINPEGMFSLEPQVVPSVRLFHVCMVSYWTAEIRACC